MKRNLLYLAGVLLVLAGAAVAYQYAQAPKRLRKARAAVREGLWEYARGELDHYMWWRRGDPEAHLLMARAIARDGELSDGPALADAFEHLRKVPDDSKWAAEARIEEAQLQLFVLHRPTMAERTLKRALAAEPDSLQANLTMWKLLDLTGRSHQARDYFWKTYDQTEGPLRMGRLQEWFMSQFFPAETNPDLIAMMNFKPIPDAPVDDQEIVRFYHFRRAEPNSPLTNAMVARWFLSKGKPKDGVKLLVDTANVIDNETSEPMFMSTLIECLIATDDYDEAAKAFKQWKPIDDHDFFASKAVVHDKCLDDTETAIEAYRQVVDSSWPGPISWQPRNLLAACLAKQGKAKEAEKEYAKGAAIKKVMATETLGEARLCVRNPADIAGLEKVHTLYSELGCEKEAKAWREVIDFMKKAKPSGLSPLELSP